MSRVIAVRVSDCEFVAFAAICEKNGLRYQELLRAILIDALVDEGYDGLRCEQSEGCEDPREASETGGATTS